MIDSPPSKVDHYLVTYIWLFAVPFGDRSCKLCSCCNLYFLLLLKCLQHRQQAITMTTKVKVRVSAIMPKLRISPYVARNIIKGWGMPCGIGENPMFFPGNFFSFSHAGFFDTFSVFQTSLSDVHVPFESVVAVADSCCIWHWAKSKIVNVIKRYVRSFASDTGQNLKYFMWLKTYLLCGKCKKHPEGSLHNSDFYNDMTYSFEFFTIIFLPPKTVRLSVRSLQSINWLLRIQISVHLLPFCYFQFNSMWRTCITRL